METLPSKAGRIGILAGLCWLYTSLHLERQILGILAESVKYDLHLQDAALGALTGSAFSIVYALLGLYFGRLADSSQRLFLVRVGACVWSIASIGAAFSPNYAFLVAGRAGVAVGEAIATAAAVSLMTELAGDRHKARAASIFFAGAFAGAGLAAILGGATLNYLKDSSVAGWRVALILAGLPGLLGALYLCAFRFRDTSLERLDSTPRGTTSMTGLVLAALLAVCAQMYLPVDMGVPLAVLVAMGAGLLWAVRLRRSDRDAYLTTLGLKAFRILLIGFAAVLFMDFAASFWLIPLAQRAFGLNAGTVGVALGGLMILGGIAGSLAGGWVADQWRRRSPAGRIGTALIATVLEAAAIAWMVMSGKYSSFLGGFAVFCVASGAWTGVAAAIGMDIVAVRHRGTGVAAYFLVTTLLGPGLAAWTAGLLGEVWHSIGTALLACAGTVVIPVLCFARLARVVRNEAALSPGTVQRPKRHSNDAP